MKARSKFGWIELILGILLIALGVLTMMRPSTALATFVILYGIVAIVTGIADIVIYVRLERRTGFAQGMTLVSGILSILAGILLLMNVGAGTWVISIIFAVWFIMHCVNRLANLPWIRAVSGTGMYWFSLILNVIGLLLGIMMLFDPLWAAGTLVYFVAFYLFVAGIGSIAMAFSKLGE